MYPNIKYLVNHSLDIVAGVHSGDIIVLSQTILRRKLKLINYANWTNQSFGLVSLDCNRNHMFQYFHPEICRRTNIVINIRQLITIYRLCFDFKK